MDYFKILNLNREPFGNSPAPEFFFQSMEHVACLQQLELAIRLRRGLNVVMGDVGTGKTTLCRQLILRFTESEDDGDEFQTRLILDPNFSTPREFLSAVAMTFGLPGVEAAESEWQLKENIKKYLFQKGVDEKKTVILIIDEGQKIPYFSREILREFLNYETNENKLLQIIIFAQNEFSQILKSHANFADRVNQLYFLKPLNFSQTKALIRFRLSRAGRPAEMPPLFTPLGLWAIYGATDGYPRRIITLCHQILLTLIIQNKVRAGWTVVRSATGRLMPDAIRRRRWASAALLSVLAFALTAFLFFLPRPLNIIPPSTAVQPRPNPVESEPIVTSRAAAKSEKMTEQPSARLEEITTVGMQPAAVKDPSAGSVQEQSSGESKSAPAMPAHLGSLKIRDGGTVLQLLLQIYGNTETNRFNAVAKANPHIKDMNRVRAGETITFPAIPAKAGSLGAASHWVQIAKKGSLVEAYQIFRRYPADQPPIRLIPTWNKKDGLVFFIILTKGFNKEIGAQEAIRNLPSEFAASLKIMEKPGKDTVYFAY
ncbi:MAG: AAA family ATPase [Syntrophales bacterium]|nr:AAA family ATPase [Syntrophales bacterium]